MSLAEISPSLRNRVCACGHAGYAHSWIDLSCHHYFGLGGKRCTCQLYAPTT